MPEPINYIMHIPKTAGRSLQGLVRRRHKKSGSLELIYTQQQVENGFVDAKELNTVMGHFRFGYHKFSSRPFRYFTFLRDPIEHIISHFHYTKDYPEKFEYLPSGVDTILDFAECSYGYNLQTLFISGIKDIRNNEDQAVEMAMETLNQHFEFVGITEQFDLSLLRLGQILNWNPIYYIKENTGKMRRHQPKPNKEEIAQLRTVLKYDIKLYEFAKLKLQEEVARHPELLKRLPLFRLENRLFQKLNPGYIWLKNLFN